MLATLLEEEDWQKNLHFFYTEMKELINKLKETFVVGDRWLAYLLIKDIANAAKTMHKMNEREFKLGNSCDRLSAYIRENTPVEESTPESK